MPADRWTGTARSRVLPTACLGGGVLVAVGVGAAVVADPGSLPASAAGRALVVLAGGVPLALLLAVGVALSSVRVDVDDERVTVRCGPWGWPRWSRRREEIASAGVTELRPGRWGGWGWRWSGGGTAVLLRAGPALRLVPRDGRPFHVSLDDPAGAVAALGLPPA